MYGVRQIYRNPRRALRPGRIATLVAALLTATVGIRAEGPPVEFSFVPAADAQPDGPAYDFRISRLEIRNDQYVAFLNNALANLTGQRGHYMFFDSNTGDVYVNASQAGQVFAGDGGLTVKMFSRTAARQIEFVDGSYRVVTTPLDYSAHPVTGVTWYGAVKYCNWLTLASDLPSEERAYFEGPSDDLSAWRPVTITSADWSVRNLTPEERDDLLDKLGYRLPMDGGVDSAGPYNEWYKVAAWDPGIQGNRTFGFGRDTITGQDANFLCSGDPFDGTECTNNGGSTPVGYYDGTDHGGAFETNPLGNQNGFDVFDMSGNVWEWMQDQSPSDPTRRRERGGSWRNSASLLEVSFSADSIASWADDAIGFRVVQSVVHDLIVTPLYDLSAGGPWGGPYDDPLSDRITYHLLNIVAEPVSFSVTTDAGWVVAAPAAGSIQPGGSVDVVVSLEPNCGEDGLLPGENIAAITIEDGAGQIVAEREARLTVREPLQLTPTAGFAPVMPFAGDPSPFNEIYTFTSESDSYVDWSAGWRDTSVPPIAAAWLTINNDAGASGFVPPQSSWPIIVAIDASVAAAFDIGTYTAEVTFVDECTGAEFVRSVTLTVVEPFSVEPVDEAISTGVSGGPFEPLTHEFTVSNLVDSTVNWAVELCSEPPGSGQCTEPTQPTWLSLDTSGGVLAAHASEEVTASITGDADSLEADAYSLTLRFEEPASGFVVERVVTLDVTGLHVEPDGDAVFTGPLAGPFQPASLVYTLQNIGMPHMSWEASVVLDPPPGPGESTWLDVEPMSGVILDEQDVDEATVTLTAGATLLTTGTYEATITFRGNDQPATDTTRRVILIVGAEAFSIPMVMVPADDVQPSGPTYTYRMGQNEITNAEFVHFLNSARRNASSNAPDERSHFMYFDIDSGDVYINVAQAGAEGTDAPSATLTTILFDASVTGEIALVDNEYAVLSAKENFPVAGVSWYGALKFCNWMTLIQGMDPAQRAYEEGTDAADWVPAAQQPVDLVALRGFRLPMDEQEPTASPYNEWYKAASRKEDDAQGEPVFGAVYGFGRDTLTPADANYRDSDDPHEPGSSPVGFFDTGNGYALNDMTGNVAEWGHDPGNTASHRGTRGGHFDNVVGSTLLRSDGRGSVPADGAFAFVGFRVLQVFELGTLELAQAPVRITGYVGGPYLPETPRLEIHNPGRQAVDDITITVDPPWLQVDGVAPGLIPPTATVNIPLSVAEDATAAGISATPPGDFAHVPGNDVQVDGPEHDFWVNRTELMNSQFVVFLNNTRANASSDTPDVRSHHMYFALDTGNVYINDEEAGDEGTGLPATLLYDASIGRIQLVDDTYQVEDGFELHPVVGVTWYGAIKYCNWLTIFEGIPASLRAYEEAPSPDLDGWHPVVVDTAVWATDGMDATARRLLVEDTLGYRLPMDDGATAASPYNEWHKFASRKGVDDQGLPVFGADFGFGRDGDAPAATDANYFDSGDTEEDGTTPVRFFNGSNTLFELPDEPAVANCYAPGPEPIQTEGTDNAYGLYDASGNVREWTQDFGTDVTDRATRGGSWRDDADSPSLTTTGRVLMTPQSATDDTSFRVVRGTGHIVAVTVTDNLAEIAYQQFFILDLREPFTLEPLVGITDPATSATYGDGFAGLAQTYTLTNRSASEMEWSVGVDRNWVEVIGPVEGELTGTIPGTDGSTPSELSFDFATTQPADALGPGTHEASVTFTNLTTGQAQTRKVTLTIEQPVTVTPEQDPPDPPVYQGQWGGPFTGPIEPPTFQLASLALDLEYDISVDQPWITLSSQDPLSGTLTPAGTVEVTAELDIEVAETLDIGEHEASLRFTWVDPENGDLSDTIERTIMLEVNDPIVITPADDAPPWVVGPELIPGALPSETYTLAHDGDGPVEVLVSVDVDWVDTGASSVEVFPGNNLAVSVSVNENALAILDGEYAAQLTFENTVTGVVQCRSILLTVNETMSVAPYDGITALGVAGGPITPLAQTYMLTNVARDGAGPVDWEVSVETAGVDWLLINGQGVATGTLIDDGDSIGVRIVIDVARTAALPPGLNEAVVAITDLTNQVTLLRTVSLTLVERQFVVAESLIPASDEQPGGPEYSYLMARYLTTNAQFVDFLNNAKANPDNERGWHMFFDTTTGDVYVNSSEAGESGSEPGPRVTRLFSPEIAGQIEFVGGAYQAVTSPVDYSQHPVAGVSWYGAVKYCNWLTVDQGLPPATRCYTEDTDANLTGWHPATIDTNIWAARHLNDAERLDLVSNYRGYRLSMDDGYDNAVVDSDQSDAYNEWYKAASRRGDDGEGNALFGAAYGFGRNTIAEADANFRCSGDPFEDEVDCTLGGTTPTGFYDGTNTLGDGTLTNASDNAYGLFDLTGNVYEWLQGRFTSDPGSIVFRTLRGGSWRDTDEAQNLRVTSRTLTEPSNAIDFVGFRVVRTLVTPSGDVNQDGNIDQEDYAGMYTRWSGPQINIAADWRVFDLQNDGDIDLGDFAVFQNLFASTP